MKIRAQLTLAFLLLAVLPLTGIVLYSYFASLRAVRRATETQAQALTWEIGGRMASIRSRALTLSSAGMPPVFFRRRDLGEAEEIALQGMPLGGLASDYQEKSLEMAAGDTILLMTDGLPEQTNGEGEPLGYPRVRSLFESLGGKPPEEVIAGLAAADGWAAGLAPKDDMTLVVIRMRAGQ